MANSFDVVIVGAGPGGTTTAIQIAKAMPNVRIALLDKGSFPKDKICGDALSSDVVNQIRLISDTLESNLVKTGAAFPISGLKIVGLDGVKSVEIPVKIFSEKLASYTCSRIDLDEQMFKETQRYGNIQFFGNCEVTDLAEAENRMKINTSIGTFDCSIAVGADGVQSVVGRKLGRVKMDKNHHAGGLRVYYEGVEGFSGNNIELHFLAELRGGYFWIFPMSNNRANVGLVMVSSQIAKKHFNLRKSLQQIISTHPVIKERFRNARPLETFKGQGLPLGGKANHISGNRFLLIGDAASLIDPLTGEGIGNAIRSGRIAADHIEKCLQDNDFSAAFNKKHDKEVHRRMRTELLLYYYALYLMMKVPSLINVGISLIGMNKKIVTWFFRIAPTIEAIRAKLSIRANF